MNYDFNKLWSPDSVGTRITREEGIRTTHIDKELLLFVFHKAYVSFRGVREHGTTFNRGRFLVNETNSRRSTLTKGGRKDKNK